MGTLVERLRAFPDNVLEGASLCEEAAAHIERLEAICASAYQFAGSVDAPVRFLDALALHDEYMQMTPDQIIETLLPTWKDDPADAAQRGGE